MFTVSNGQVMFNGRPVDQMTEEERRNAYGSAGNINSGAQVYDFSTGSSPGNLDPKYWESYTINRGDSDTATGYRLRPEYARMQGMMQVGVPRSVGGSGEAIDPSGITYDQEFGYVTPLTNVQQPESTWLQRNLPYLLAAGMGGAIGMAGGFSGLLGAGSGSGGAGLGSYSGMTTGLDGLTGTLAAEGAGAGSLGMVSGLEPITLPALEGAPVLEGLPTMETLGSTPWYSQALQNMVSNPFNALRAGMGLASIVEGIRNRDGGSPDGGRNNGLLSNGTAPKLDFTGLLSNYKPLQFDPVPFMSGRYGGK